MRYNLVMALTNMFLQNYADTKKILAITKPKTTLTQLMHIAHVQIIIKNIDQKQN